MLALAIAAAMTLVPFSGPAMTSNRVMRVAVREAASSFPAVAPAASGAAAGTACDGVDVTTATVDLASFKDLKGDGTNDVANELILECIFENVSAGATILVPSGATYAHSSTLYLGVGNVTIKAEGTGSTPTLESTGTGTAACPLFQNGWSYPGPCLAVIVAGNGDSISNLDIANAHASTHGTTPAQHGMVLTGDSQTLTNVTIYNSDGVGIETLGATNLYLDHPTFDFTGNASLIFHPGLNGGPGTGNVLVQDPTINDPGDDGICVESYLGGNRDHDIWINGEVYTNNLTSGSHGLAVVGGNNIVFTNFAQTGATASGIYVASGQVFGDSGSNNVVIGNGIIANADTAAPSGLQNGAVLVWSDAASPEVIDQVLIENVAIASTNAAANYQVGDFPNAADPAAQNVEFKNLTFTGNTQKLLTTGSTPSKNYWTLNWQVQNPATAGAPNSVTALPDHSPGTPPFPN